MNANDFTLQGLSDSRILPNAFHQSWFERTGVHPFMEEGIEKRYGEARSRQREKFSRLRTRTYMSILAIFGPAAGILMAIDTSSVFAPVTLIAGLMVFLIAQITIEFKENRYPLPTCPNHESRQNTEDFKKALAALFTWVVGDDQPIEAFAQLADLGMEKLGQEVRRALVKEAGEVFHLEKLKSNRKLPEARRDHYRSRARTVAKNLAEAHAYFMRLGLVHSDLDSIYVDAHPTQKPAAA